jgi:hypothetical protein
MPRRVVDWLTRRWTTDNNWIAVVCKMVPLCLLWCMLRERNDRCFEELERTLEELKSISFNTLYLWTATYVSPVVISYHDFLVLLAPTF